MPVRGSVEDDAEAMRQIYNAEIPLMTTFDLVPRSLDDQRAWIAEHSGAHPAVVFESDGSVIGFGSLSRYRSRPAYLTTVEDSVYVSAEHRGRGVGRALLEELLDRAGAHGFHTVMARVVASNEASVALHRGLGFELVGTEREVGRKLGRWLDVTILQKLLRAGPEAVS